MSMSNIEYSALKKKGGLHNRGFLSGEDFEPELIENLDDLDMEQDAYSSDVLQQNSYGEYYALQDFEE